MRSFLIGELKIQTTLVYNITYTNRGAAVIEDFYDSNGKSDLQKC